MHHALRPKSPQQPAASEIRIAATDNDLNAMTLQFHEYFEGDSTSGNHIFPAKKLQ
jgi:hypothetical protein